MKAHPWFLPCLVTGIGGCDQSLPVGPVQPGPGALSVLDAGGPQGQTGWWPSLAFDSTGQPHLSYCDAHNGDLRYATRIQGRWRSESVVSKGAVGKYAALAVDSKGKVGIAFYDQDTKYLRYAWQTAGGWKTERLAWGLEIGMAGELRFDSNDVPHLFYYVPSGRLIHAHRPSGGEWKKVRVAEASAGFSVRISPVLRPDGFWVTFVDWRFGRTSLLLGRPGPNGELVVETVAKERAPGWRSQLLFEGGEPVIIFSENMGQHVQVARRQGDQWKLRKLLDNAANLAAVQNADGDILLAYEDVFQGSPGNGTVKYLRGRGESWQRYAVEPEGPAGEYLAIAANAQGRPMIAYFSAVIRGIKIYDESK